MQVQILQYRNRQSDDLLAVIAYIGVVVVAAVAVAEE